MPLVYRVQKKQFVESVLTGEGARLFGGRWNPPGVPLIYTSTTPELALLETLVHLDGTSMRELPPFVRITIDLPDAIEVLPDEALPAGWAALKHPPDLPYFLLSKLHAVYPALAFSLPSVVLADSPSRNVLINPLHPLIGQVRVVSIVPHVFDARLR